ncbi:MAG: hypothetical protein JW881_13780 [Spirochaetales bacterium]|nr:hypothetical protein [Spirochaetales bacterium]
MKRILLFTVILVAASVISCVSTGGGGGGAAEEIQLHAIDAQLVTLGGLIYEAQGDRECIGWWESPNDQIIWDFEVANGGEYMVVLKVACASSFAGSKVGVTIDSQKLEFIMPDTYEWETYFDVEAGTVKLDPGPHKITVQGIELVNRFFGNLQLVTLKKV